MRKLKFRAKTKTGKWVEGLLFYSNKIVTLRTDNKSPFVEKGSANYNYDYYDIDPKTVGQFTGLKDKNGKAIYEHDILKINGQIDVCYNSVFNVIEKDKFELISKVVYNDSMACFELETIEPDINVQHWEFYGEGTECFEVIGNIHETYKL